MFSYQKSFVNPTLPVDEQQFYALVRATQWNDNIDKYRETGEASLKRKLPAFIFQAMFDETLSKNGKVGRWRKQAATRLTGLVVMDVISSITSMPWLRCLAWRLTKVARMQAA